MPPLLRLTREPRTLHADATVTWRVDLGGHWIGWVGDARPPNATRFARRHWWACWREDGDRWARDNAHDFPTRRAAVLWLITRATSPRKETPTP
ncbi:MAG: hypothetical protein QG608_1975 [Actinomycetota bacterium]|nr:hypothetical protein [Actinomycetota bacterium]